MTPLIDVTQTLEFIKSYLTEEGATILEVGCGDGRLAAEMNRAGYRVTGIDLSPEKIEKARRLDVQAEVADVLEYEANIQFDAVLFTRSLHHIHNLDAVMNKVKTLLGEKGRILVDDFAIDEMDERTADWFYELRDVVDLAAGRAPAHPGEAPLARWKAEHHHEPALHSKTAMVRALELKFGNVHATKAPYLYRYFVDSCEHSPLRSEAVNNVFAWEKRLIDKGTIQPIGLRVVAKKYFSYLR